MREKLDAVISVRCTQKQKQIIEDKAYAKRVAVSSFFQPLVKKLATEKAQ
jgi:hypothetical protein